MLSADELLAGANLTFDVDVPPELVPSDRNGVAGSVRLRPLAVRDLQLIARAAKESDALAAVLMVQAALLEPKLSLPQTNALPVGLLQFLLGEVNRISGIDADGPSVQRAAGDPLLRAAFLLAREFGWTPEQVGGLTLGQILVHLELLKERNVAHA